MIKFKKGHPKYVNDGLYLVKCPEYCHFGYDIAVWDGLNWNNCIGDDALTEHVIGYFKLKLEE